MAKKYHCQKCQKPIEEGKQIKWTKKVGYHSHRYSGSRNYITYYLCPECYEQQQKETQSQEEKVWRRIVGSSLILLVVLIAMLTIFLLYQHYRDRKLDRITRKAQKKTAGKKSN